MDFRPPPLHSDPPRVRLDGEVTAERFPVLDNTEWRSLDYLLFGVRSDGTLWRFAPNYGRRLATENRRVHFANQLVQMGSENNWVSAAHADQRLVALQADGSLWQWELPWGMSYDQFEEFLSRPPTRLGTHRDWVGIGGSWEGVVALAADGGLWIWPGKGQNASYSPLRSSRKPSLVANLLDRPGGAPAGN